MATKSKGGKTATQPKSAPKVVDDSRMALGMRNYKIMLIGFAIIVLGFILMIGGDGTSAEVFDYSMFSFRRITVAPILVLGGFGVIAYGIMSKGKKTSDKEE